MTEPFRQILREYFSFSKKDRRAILALCAIILFFISGNLVLKYIEPKPDSASAEIIAVFEKWDAESENTLGFKSLFHFNPNTVSAQKFDSLDLPAFVKKNMLSYRAAGGSFKNAAAVRKIYGMNDSIYAAIEKYIDIPSEITAEPNVHSKSKGERAFRHFDPNTAGADELLNLGFNSFQISNLIKYRKSGGTFSEANDLLKIYGIDSAFFNSLKNYIEIDEKPVQVSEEDVEEPALFVVDINTADATELQKLRGIGAVFSGRIIKYRNLLGGFYDKHQLLEVYGFPEETFHSIKGNIVADSLQVKKLRLNFADYSELLRHPYLRKEQVEAILNYRDENGPFRSVEYLLSENLLDTASFKALVPYLTCR
ncbi:competence protein ComEA helix-hairpin-helix repeat region [Mariniphaga anaerophila]|uniref:Competence protein ComEA helix-hairpin-helix repeat region n=1 Tax=Mariniphaga anaerophila TaxID=1484053 RepID=A0A1M5DAF3_9BACT|nr:helix-hairpin-helix domain-containing protein [Mariniphaga anaerophila]SHF63989.1 competence protein ComEA helix-hairpin-helix repeat region [Mariniphaga anaerophila]